MTTPLSTILITATTIWLAATLAIATSHLEQRDQRGDPTPISAPARD
jgi:hypothetical protein